MEGFFGLCDNIFKFVYYLEGVCGLLVDDFVNYINIIFLVLMEVFVLFIYNLFRGDVFVFLSRIMNDDFLLLLEFFIFRKLCFINLVKV